MTSTVRRIERIEMAILEQRKAKWEALFVRCEQIPDVGIDLDETAIETAMQALISRHPWLDHRHEADNPDEWEILTQQGLSRDEIESRIDPPTLRSGERLKLEQEIIKIKGILENDDLTSNERIVCQSVLRANEVGLALFL